MGKAGMNFLPLSDATGTTQVVTDSKVGVAVKFIINGKFFIIRSSVKYWSPCQLNQLYWWRVSSLIGQEIIQMR